MLEELISAQFVRSGSAMEPFLTRERPVDAA
jgi:hypothetical protein